MLGLRLFDQQTVPGTRRRQGGVVACGAQPFTQTEQHFIAQKSWRICLYACCHGSHDNAGGQGLKPSGDVHTKYLPGDISGIQT